MAANGGDPCKGALKETGSCSAKPPVPINCTFKQWTAWAECSLTCGHGYKQRYRNIKHAASDGGHGCVGELKEVVGCFNRACGDDKDCELGDWEEWSKCDGHQQTRKRKVVQEA